MGSLANGVPAHATPAAVRDTATVSEARALQLWPATRTFRVVSLTGHRLVPGTRIRLTFGAADAADPDAGRLGGNAGCNHFFGAGRVSAGRLVVGNLGSTRMWCGRARMHQEGWFTTLLTGRPIMRLNGHGLLLRSGDVVVRFVELRSR